MPTRTAKSAFGIKEFSGWATFLTVGSGSGSWSCCDSNSASDDWTLGTLLLASLRLVGATRACLTCFVADGVECSNGAWDCMGDRRLLLNYLKLFIIKKINEVTNRNRGPSQPGRSDKRTRMKAATRLDQVRCWAKCLQQQTGHLRESISGVMFERRNVLR